MVPNELLDAFVNVSFSDESGGNHKSKGTVWSDWGEHGSAQIQNTALEFKNILKKHYPDYSVVSGLDYQFPLFSFPDLIIQPLPGVEMDSLFGFIPFARRDGPGGALVQSLRFGAFTAAWKDYDFYIFFIQWPIPFGRDAQFYILHKGPEEPAMRLLTAVGIFEAELGNAILVFNQGFWSKDYGLWEEVQRASWDDVILKQEFKDAIQGDIRKFFASESVYKELQVPWKRGLIFYGPAGNGKTVSLKAAMHETTHPVLYVRSFQSWAGEEYAMAQVFAMARRYAPCLLVIEDLDSHINDSNRSFFLNELDGLDNNDGLLLIGTTNHLDRLDGSISKRPSRFDRKYLFDDPDESERRLYCSYWQSKLKNNKKVSFPDELADEISKLSDGFSFAYLKEAFVSTLLLIAGDDKLEFEETIKDQIKQLKKQLEEEPKNPPGGGYPGYPGPGYPGAQNRARPPTQSELEEFKRKQMKNSMLLTLPSEMGLVMKKWVF